MAEPALETTFALEKLLLDVENPRFGAQGNTNSQAEILDQIVEKHGVDDVLSSLAVNGYFSAEPMVCRQEKGEDYSTVVEGNRRLAACLILTGDDRAANQAARTLQYQKVWKKHGSKQIDPVPVILFVGREHDQTILSYLGVRHIASAQPWDSYAKAAWVARVVKENQISVADVASMIGDKHRTVNRLLEGFYFVEQLIDAALFRPEDSIRRGRGSVTEYPFSWVYTVLGYKSVREFLDLADDGANEDPIKDEFLQKASMLIHAMFGNRSKGKSAAVEDSRQLGTLASAVASKEKVSWLEQGKTLSEIEILAQPLEDRLRQGLADVRDIQGDLITRISENDIPIEVATDILPLSGKNRKLAIELDKKIKEAAFGDDDE